jgi:hypothetical protein
VRYYDNRYYLLGSAIDEETYKPTNLLQTYTMDKFTEKKVYPAIQETEEIQEEDILIFYDYAALYKATKLEDLLKHSLGVWYNWKENQLKTYRLKFTDWAMGIMENKKIHPSQVVKEKNSDFLIVEITVWENHEMDYFLGRFGDKCERLN